VFVERNCESPRFVLFDEMERAMKPSRSMVIALAMLVLGMGAAWPDAGILAMVVSSLIAIPLFVLGVSLESEEFRTLDRRTRGHCPECDYELRYDFRHGCSECGWRRAS
jgi:hypothetical protein